MIISNKEHWKKKEFLLVIQMIIVPSLYPVVGHTVGIKLKSCPKLTGVTGSWNSRVSFGDTGEAPEVMSKLRPGVCVRAYGTESKF